MIGRSALMIEGGRMLLLVIVCVVSYVPAGPVNEMAGSDETAPAIIARSTQYGDGPRRPAPFDFARDAIAGILHQLPDRRPGADGQTIDLAHPRTSSTAVANHL
jgi:hypothetical protein